MSDEPSGGPSAINRRETRNKAADSAQLSCASPVTILRPNTVAGLIAKRREIAGRIEHTQRALNELIADLDHIDHTIRLFDPDADLGRAKPYPARQGAFRGEMARFVLAALREAQEPVTSLSIARQVMAGRGLDAGEARMVITMRKRVGACLWKLKAKGVARQVPIVGEYKGWQLNRQGEG